MILSNTNSKVYNPIYQDENNDPSSHRSSKRTLSDELDITPHNRMPRNRSPLQTRSSKTPFSNKENLTPYNAQKVESNKIKSTATQRATKDLQITLRNSKTVPFGESQITYDENEIVSSIKRFKNESGQIVNVDSYKKRIEQLEAELRRQIDENQKQREESQKSCQEAEKELEKAKCEYEYFLH